MEKQEFKISIQGAIDHLEQFNSGVRLQVFGYLMQLSKRYQIPEFVKFAEEIHKRDKLPAQIVCSSKLLPIMLEVFQKTGVVVIQNNMFEHKDHQYTILVMWEKHFEHPHLRDIVFGPPPFDDKASDNEMQEWANKLKGLNPLQEKLKDKDEKG